MNNAAKVDSPFKLVVGLAAVVVILAGLKTSADFLSPILLAIFFAILITPIYFWLQRRGLPAWVAMLVVLAGIVTGAIALSLFFSAAVNQLLAQLSTYQDAATANLAELQGNWPALAGGETAAAVAARASQLMRSMLLGVLGLVSTMVVIVVVMIFCILEARPVHRRLEASLGEGSPLLQQATGFARSMVRYFAIRTRINLFTGFLVVLMLLLLRIDFALLWGVLTFFLSYVPYVGIVLATAPSVAIAFAQGGVFKAVLVILGVSVINLSAENVVAPTLLGRGLSVSPVIVFVSFIFWASILGAPGTVLAMPLTIVVMLVLAAFDSTRWLAVLMGMPANGFDLSEDVPGETKLSTDTGTTA